MPAPEPIEIKSKPEIAALRRAGRVAAKILKEVSGMIKPGVSTGELNRFAERTMRQHGAVPTFLGYRGYPASICASIDEEVVHGIPNDKRILKEGSIISIDLAVTLDGFIGDVAATYAVGEMSPFLKKLVELTHEALWCGIAAACAGKRVGDISNAIEQCATKRGFNVVRDFVGHGVGRRLHEEPPVPNFGHAGTGLRLEPGMALALEPMVVTGNYEVKVLDDGWTVVTRDRTMAAHFEHTIVIGESGPEIMTTIS